MNKYGILLTVEYPRAVIGDSSDLYQNPFNWWRCNKTYFPEEYHSDYVALLLEDCQGKDISYDIFTY